MERLGIEPLSVFGMPPVPFIELAADLGLRYIAIMLTAMPNSYGYPPFSLRNDRELRWQTLATLHDRGVTIALGEGMVIREDTDMRDLATDIAVMGELGAHRVNTMSFDADLHRTIDRFGAVAELAAAAGMETTFEFGPTKPVGRTLPEGVEIIERSAAEISGSSSTRCTSSARAPGRRTSRRSTRSSSGTSSSPTRRSSRRSRTTWRRRASSAWFRNGRAASGRHPGGPSARRRHRARGAASLAGGSGDRTTRTPRSVRRRGSPPPRTERHARP